jgi:hypothetical protein
MRANGMNSDPWPAWKNPTVQQQGASLVAKRHRPARIQSRLEAGGWRLEAGGWRLEAGGWRLEAGGWRLERL